MANVFNEIHSRVCEKPITWGFFLCFSGYIRNCFAKLWFQRRKSSMGNAHLISHDPRSVWGLQRLVIILSGTISNIDSFIKYSRNKGFPHGLLVACSVFVHFVILIFTQLIRWTRKILFLSLCFSKNQALSAKKSFDLFMTSCIVTCLFRHFLTSRRSWSVKPGH